MLSLIKTDNRAYGPYTKLGLERDMIYDRQLCGHLVLKDVSKESYVW